MKHTIPVVVLLVACSFGGLQGQGLPQPPEGLGGRARLMFPAVVDFLYDGDFDVVPDDRLFRAYVLSVFRGMEELCGTWDSQKDGPARRYGIEWLPGSQGEGEEPGIAGFQALLGRGADPETGAVGGAAAAGAATGQDSTSSLPAAYMTEGIQDGAALAATFQCNSLEGRTLRSRMLGLFTQESAPPAQDFDPVRCLRLLHPQWRPLFEGCGVPSWAASAEGASTLRSTAGKERLLLLEQDDRAYALARRTRGVAEVREYLRVFGTWGVHVREVRALFDSLDAAAFQEAVAAGTIPAFQSYLEAFPGGPRNPAAVAAIAAFEERAWDGARAARSDSAFSVYLELYPEGVHAAGARSFLDLNAQARLQAATVAAVADTLRSARTRRALSAAATLTALAGAGTLGFLAYRGYGRFGELEQALALVSPDSLSVFGPLDAEKGATGRRTAFQAASSAALVAATLFLRSIWEGYSQTAEAARGSLSTARDSLAAIEGQVDELLQAPPRPADGILPSLSLRPFLGSDRGPGVVLHLSLPVGGGGAWPGAGGTRPRRRGAGPRRGNPRPGSTPARTPAPAP
jgi:hypothetical protein